MRHPVTAFNRVTCSRCMYSIGVMLSNWSMGRSVRAEYQKMSISLVDKTKSIQMSNDALKNGTYSSNQVHFHPPPGFNCGGLAEIRTRPSGVRDDLMSYIYSVSHSRSLVKVLACGCFSMCCIPAAIW